MKIGLIGLDSSHVLAWLGAAVAGEGAGADADAGERSVEWTGAWGEASPDMALSRDRIEGITREVRERGVLPILGSVAEVVATAEAVIVCGVDARRRAEVVAEVLRARRDGGLRVFVDKPLALSGAVGAEIVQRVRARGGQVMSCSCFRPVGLAVAATVGARLESGGEGAVLHVRAPLLLEPAHGRYFWYGIHAVELLYACFGPGCVAVAVERGLSGEVATARWGDGRAARIEWVHDGAAEFSLGIEDAAGRRSEIDLRWDYARAQADLWREMVRFFGSGIPLVPAEETAEILRFLEAAERSWATGGEVALES